jgi:LacI family transcriptional regulator
MLAEKCVELVLTEEQGGVPTLTLLPVRFEYGGTTKPHSIE